MSRRTEIDVRPITEAEFPDWNRALNTGFLRPPAVAEEQLEARRNEFVPGRSLGAFDGDRCVATFRSFDQELTAVGGGLVRADAVSNVTVTATHRRRGLLTRMMAQDLAAAKERGDVVATLIAAEYRIYGRYGFGPATSMTEWAVDVPRAGLDPRWAAPEDGGRIDLVDGADVRRLGRAARAAAPGPAGRGQPDRAVVALPDRCHRLERLPLDRALLRPVPLGGRRGRGHGLLPDRRPLGRRQAAAEHGDRGLAARRDPGRRARAVALPVLDRLGPDGEERLALPDDLLPHLLPDPRAARITTQADWLWVRILDVARALEARTYEGQGSVVLEVVDRGGLTGGRWRLEAGPDGASCAPTTESAHFVLDVGDLAALWLGDESAVRLAALGRVREERAGAARVVDALLRTSRRPWCPDMF